MLMDTRTGIRDSNGAGRVFLEVYCDQEVMVRLRDLHANIIKEVLESGYTPAHDHPDHLVFDKPAWLVRLVYRFVADIVLINTRNAEMVGLETVCESVGINHSPVMMGGVYSFNFRMQHGRRYRVWFRMNIQNALRPSVAKQPWWKRLWTWVK